MNYNNNNQQQVQCIARSDFFGDVNLSQLCFKQNTPLEVDFSIPPQNGWRLGICYGHQGWLPEWAVEPVGQQMSVTVPPSSCRSSPPPIITIMPQQSRRSYKRNSLRRSRDYITPLQSISERTADEGQQPKQPQQQNNAGGCDCDGFDQRNNDIMGGNVPRAKTVDGSSCNVVDDSSANNQNPCENVVPDANNGGSSSKNKWGIKKLFQKQKVGTNNNTFDNHYKNPYTQEKSKEPEWDGCEVPQIVSGIDGQVAIIEADGHASHYKNEKTYQIATTTNQIAEQVSVTTKNVGHRIANFKMPPMPKMNNNNNNNNKYSDNTDNSQQKQEQQPQQKQQEVIVVATNNDEQKQPKKNKKYGISMPSSLKMPKMPAMPKMSSGNNKFKEEQQQISTPYCDVNGNQQTIVEERKRASRTSLNIYY